MGGERYPQQDEILRYLNYCADKLDLKRDIQKLNQRVQQWFWNDAASCWHIMCQSGLKLKAKYLITAVGCLSSANHCKIGGLQNFQGDTYHTGEWPHEGVDFTGKSVVVIENRFNRHSSHPRYSARCQTTHGSSTDTEFQRACS